MQGQARSVRVADNRAGGWAARRPRAPEVFSLGSRLAAQATQNNVGGWGGRGGGEGKGEGERVTNARAVKRTAPARRAPACPVGRVTCGMDSDDRGTSWE